MAFNDFIKKVIYGNDNDGEYDNDDFDDYTQDESEEQPAVQQTARPARTQDRPEPAPYTGSVSSGNVNMTSGSAIEMKVVKPDTLETVTQIADSLLDRKTILLNLEDTSKETARRLIDFLNGVSYAINGDLKKVASNTYVVTPNNVAVSGENLKEISEKADLV